ncbi:MAG: peptide ABC transporter substrate-binding protein [Deltaproteobacteria bacterium]|nr:peptide ABC transporter substrate-binding protein [Deltaproteobacteria bacterium]
MWRASARKGLPGVLLVALLGAPMAGCQRCVSTSVPPKTASERVLNFNNLAEPEYLDPGMVQGNVEYNLCMALFEGLLVPDPKTAEPIPGVAERWEMAKDGRVYTFHLRRHAQWSDGHPVTAHDFVYAWERVLNPETGAPFAYILYYLKNARAYNLGTMTDPRALGVRAVDDHTLEVTLEHPTTFFLKLLPLMTYMPVPRWAIEAHGPLWTRPEHIVTNGPFALTAWIPYKEILVKRSPTYWDAASVRLAGVRFHPLEEKETALKMYLAGELDVDWELPVLKMSELRSHPEMVEGPRFALYFYRLNTARPPLDDPRVRRALAMAIDRETLVNQYLQQTQIPTDTLMPAGVPQYRYPQGPGFHPQQARELLRAAGFADPATFPPLTIHYNTDDRHKLIAQVIQQMWKTHLGISVQLFNEEWKSYLKTWQTRNYEISRAGWVGDYVDPQSFLDLFTSTSTQNATGWGNPEYDRLVEAASADPDQARRYALLESAETLLLDEMPMVPIMTYIKMMLVKPAVKGIYSNVLDLHPLKTVSFDMTP